MKIRVVSAFRNKVAEKTFTWGALRLRDPWRVSFIHLLASMGPQKAPCGKKFAVRDFWTRVGIYIKMNESAKITCYQLFM